MKRSPPAPLRVIDRRRFLQALGLGALTVPAGAGLLRLGAGRARAGTEPTIRRTVFVVTAHGHVWNGWHMAIPGVPTTVTSERSLLGLTADDLSPTLAPFHEMRDRILPIEGLARTTVLGEFAALDGMPGVDLNNHNLALSHALTAQPALQRGTGVTCIGGGISIDQELGRRSTGPGRLAAPVFGANHYLPYSFLEAGREAPRVEDPETIYADLLGLYRPPPTGETPTRDERVDAARASAIDTAAREYEFVLARSGREARRKLEDHRDLLRDLERGLAVTSSARCDPTFVPEGDALEQYFALATMALACDMTRVITVVPPILRPVVFGDYPPEADLHGNYAHSSVDDGGEPFNPVSERAMIDYNRWYARHVAAFLRQLDGILDGDGTLLDHTAVVWLPELGSPTHQHIDACTLIAGGTDFFRLGNYVRFERSFPTPYRWSGRDFSIGPSTNQLFVTLLRWMGHADETFGSTSVTGRDGTVIPMRGSLTPLHV